MTGSCHNFSKAEPELKPKARARTASDEPRGPRYSFIDHTGFSRGGAS